MAYVFYTPTVSEGPLARGPLFSRFRLVKAITVLKIDGDYYEVRYPAEEDVTAADIAYIGGGRYEVDAAEKADLEAAGYTVVTE